MTSLAGTFRLPLARSDGVDVLNVHGVNLLKSTVLGFDQEEEDNEYKDCTAAGEDQTVVVVNSIGDETGTKKDVSNCHQDTQYSEIVLTRKKSCYRYVSHLFLSS